MSNQAEQTQEGEDPKPSDPLNPSEQSDHSQEWEIMARAWLSSFPEAKAGSMEEVEAWIDSNHASLPGNLKSMPRSDLCQRLISIQNLMRLSTQGKEEIQGDQGDQGDLGDLGDLGDPGDLPHARFQRTDQWIPVYSWLESLQQDEVVKSKEISDWLTENPTIRDQLCSRHSRYHLMHYIKKCHLKILKRKEKKKASHLPEKSPLKVHKDVMMKPALPPRKPFSACYFLKNLNPRFGLGRFLKAGAEGLLLFWIGFSMLNTIKKWSLPTQIYGHSNLGSYFTSALAGDSFSDLPKDSDAYLAKRKEAFRKYEILVELEKLLAPNFSKSQGVK